MKTAEEMNIFEKMSAITDELGRVAKNLNVGFGQNTYKAVGEADVLAAVKPVENKYHVYSYPVKREIITSEFVTSTDKNGNEKTSPFMRISTVYRFVNIDKPEEFIEIITYGDGVDPQDKAPGKAMTYADKYALLKAYKIETGDDPDQDASKDLTPAKKAYSAPKRETIKPAALTLEEAKKFVTKSGKSFGSLNADMLQYIIDHVKDERSKKAAEMVLDELLADDADLQPVDEDCPF